VEGYLYLLPTGDDGVRYGASPSTISVFGVWTQKEMEQRRLFGEFDWRLLCLSSETFMCMYMGWY